MNWRVVLKNTGVNAETLQFRRWRPQRCTETCQAGRERWGRRECRVPRSALQTSTMCAIFKWLNDDKRVTFDYAVSLVDEWVAKAKRYKDKRIEMNILIANFAIDKWYKGHVKEHKVQTTQQGFCECDMAGWERTCWRSEWIALCRLRPATPVLRGETCICKWCEFTAVVFT